MDMVIKPVEGRLMVKEVSLKEEKRGSLYIPETVTGNLSLARVVAAGDWYREGELIMRLQYSGTQFEVNGQEYYMIHKDDVIALVEMDEDLLDE